MFVVQAAWSERYDAASATVQALQQRLEETKHSSREKDATVTKLKNHLHQLEEAMQNACKERWMRKRPAWRKNTRCYRMWAEQNPLNFPYAVIFDHKGQCDDALFFLQLLHEYDSLRREHEGAKVRAVLSDIMIQIVHRSAQTIQLFLS